MANKSDRSHCLRCYGCTIMAATRRPMAAQYQEASMANTSDPSGRWQRCCDCTVMAATLPAGL